MEPWEFIENWTKENVGSVLEGADPSCDTPYMTNLADSMVSDAEQQGISRELIAQHTGGNVTDWFTARYGAMLKAPPG